VSAILEVRNLNKSFGGIRVAQNINLALHAGKVLGLIGPNGAGKTTLFNLVLGIIKPDSGSVLLDDRPLDTMPTFQRVRLGLARTWQHVRLFPSLTVLDNLLVGTKEYPGEDLAQVLFQRAKVRDHMAASLDRAHEILAMCALESCAQQTMADLPYGRQKLVGVARALMGDARCLLLDEPMAGVEGQFYVTMQKVVRDVAESGVAVAVVEHNVGFIKDLCDEGVFMFAGEILARGSVSDLMTDPSLTELYFGS
jgi:branched-chain amino acid transport system ATP-binding protein